MALTGSLCGTPLGILHGSSLILLVFLDAVEHWLEQEGAEEVAVLKEQFQMSAGAKHNAGQAPEVGVPLVLMGVTCIKSLGNRLLLLKE